MKNIFFILFSFFTLNLNAQSIGALTIKSFVNKTNDLSDNLMLDSTMVRIRNKHYSIDTIIWISGDVKNRTPLKTGKYQITCTVNETSIELIDVLISGDQITFVDLLFEPDKKLNFLQSKKRKKLFDNY